MTEEVLVATPDGAQPAAQAENAAVDAVNPTGGEVPQTQDSTAEKPEEAKLPDAAQKRIDELTAQAKDVKKWKQQAREYERQLKEMQSAKETKAEGEPKPEDFETTEDYLIAKGKHQAKQEIAAEREAAAKAQEEANRQKFVADKRAAFEAQEAELRKTAPDYDTVVQSFNEYLGDLPDEARNTMAYQAFTEAVLDSDNIAAVSYELGKNPELLEKMKGYGPVRIIKEIARIEFGLTGKEATQTKPVTPVSQPPKPVGGSGKVSQDMYDMDAGEMLKRLGVK